jgi:hypothetical protein
MVRETALRRLSGILACVLVAACTAASATGEDMCAALAIPPTLGLACAPAPDLAPGAVVIAPAAGTFKALSRMTVRPLERTGQDELAWTDPAEWLRRQMTLNTSGYAGLMAGLADSPDSPFAGEEARTALQGLSDALGEVGRLPLSACEAPAETRAGRWEMRCSFTPGGVGMLVHLRLVAEGERRWAITMRAANEQRLRHFEAIANGFTPTT